MPFLVAPLAGLLGGSFLATAAANIIVGVGGSLIARALQPKQKPQGPGAVSLDAPTSGDSTPQTLLLGRRAVAGHRTAPEYSRGNGKEWLTIIRDLADHPVNGLVAIWIGNDRIAMPSSFPAWSDASVFHELGGKYAGKARLRFHDGTQTQADNFLRFAYGSDEDRPWTADMVLSGVAYVIIELKRDQELFPGIPELLFEVEGHNALIDPRSGNPVYSANLAIHAYNIMRGITMPDGSIYGGGIPDADLPQANWSSAASEAAAEGWFGSMEIAVGPKDMGGDEPWEIVEHLMTGCAGQVAESGGIWRTRIGGPGLPVATVTDRDVLVSEDQVFSPHQGPREVYNGVSASYPEPGERWEMKITPIRSNAAYEARDGGRNLMHLSYYAVTDSERVQQLNQMALEDNRRQREHELSLPADYAPVEVLDTLRLSLPYDGYVNKLVEILAAWNDPVTMRKRVQVREVDPNDYTRPSVQPLPTQPVVTTPPVAVALPGWAVLPVVVQDEEGRDRRSGVMISWEPLPYEGIEWELRSLGRTELSGEGTTQAVEKGQKVITAGVISGARMQIRGRPVVRNRPRAWTAWTEFLAFDVRLGSLDLQMGEIQEEVRESLSDFTDWMDGTGEVISNVRDEIDAIRDGTADGLFGALVARDDLRRELVVEVGNARASFEEQIDVIITEQLSAAIRTSELRTEFNTSTALVREEMIALTGPESALAARIDSVEGSVGTAVGEATDAIVTRVSQIERVAGTSNRVHRLGSAPTANVTNGDYWQNTTTGQWSERVNNAWVAIAASSVPRIIIEQAVTSDAISQVSARTNRGTANGLLRISAESSPAGVQSRIGLRAEASDSDSTHTAAMFLEANTDGTSQVIIAANRFAVATGQGPAATRLVPFVVDGGMVYMSGAYIQDLTVGTLKIANEAVTTYPFAYSPGVRNIPVEEYGTWVTLQTLTFNRGRSAPMPINLRFDYAGGSTIGTINFRLVRDGISEPVWTRSSFSDFSSHEVCVDSNSGTGEVTYRLQANVNVQTGGFNIDKRFIGALNAYK